MTATGQGTTAAPARLWLVVLPGSALFVLAAVVLEITGGVHANSPLPAWAELVPLAWPTWARVLWWSAVAGAAAAFRLGLRRVGLPTKRLADVATVAPFVAFVLGIVLGADWATWH